MDVTPPFESPQGAAALGHANSVAGPMLNMDEPPPPSLCEEIDDEATSAPMDITQFDSAKPQLVSNQI
jgi:hypothetical protein